MRENPWPPKQNEGVLEPPKTVILEWVDGHQKSICGIEIQDICGGSAKFEIFLSRLGPLLAQGEVPKTASFSEEKARAPQEGSFGAPQNSDFEVGGWPSKIHLWD